MPKIKLTISAVVFMVGFMLIDPSVYMLMTIGAAAAHEAGHIAAMLLCGTKPSRITIYPFGVDMMESGGIRSYRDDIFIAAAGAAVNMALFALCCRGAPFFALCNLALAAVNLLPVKTLDGGAILLSLLLMRMNEDEAQQISKFISFIFILLLWSGAAYILFRTGGNLSLFLMCAYLFAVIFLKETEE